MGSDDLGHTLSLSLYGSIDKGQTWSLIKSDLESSYELNTTAYVNGTILLIELHLSDGYRFTSASENVSILILNHNIPIQSSDSSSSTIDTTTSTTSVTTTNDVINTPGFEIFSIIFIIWPLYLSKRKIRK